MNLQHSHQALDLTWGQILVHNFTDVSMFSPHLLDDIVFLRELSEALDFCRVVAITLNVKLLPICLSFPAEFVEVQSILPKELWIH